MAPDRGAFAQALEWGSHLGRLVYSVVSPFTPEVQTGVPCCPSSWKQVFRILILNHHRDTGKYFLEAAVSVCRAFEVTPVILTVAGSELEGLRRQRSAEDALANLRFSADFDLLAGRKSWKAVTGVVRWRRCSHVILENDEAFSWWPTRRISAMKLLADLSNSCTVLALPAQPKPVILENGPSIYEKAGAEIRPEDSGVAGNMTTADLRIRN
jgi:hypothetical protein